MSGTIDLQRRGRCGWITISRPDKLNALAGDMRPLLRDRIGEAARDDGVDALVIIGAGRAFCAGGDVATMQRLHDDKDEAGFRQILHDGAECVLALQAFPGLTIAAVNGVAAGAGLALALGCDLRVAAATARLAASWGGLGLAPDWGATFWLPRLVGSARALELILTRDAVDAERACALGLVNEVVAADRLESRCAELAAMAGARETVRETKRLLRKGLTGTLEASLAAETEVQEDLFAGDDVAEGLRAFAEKRPPRFGEDGDA